MPLDKIEPEARKAPETPGAELLNNRNSNGWNILPTNTGLGGHFYL
jgi:hypothetical protein